MLKPGKDPDLLAKTIALQVITGTLPAEGMVVCETPEAAEKLVKRIKHYVNVYSGIQ